MPQSVNEEAWQFGLGLCDRLYQRSWLSRSPGYELIRHGQYNFDITAMASLVCRVAILPERFLDAMWAYVQHAHRKLYTKDFVTLMAVNVAERVKENWPHTDEEDTLREIQTTQRQFQVLLGRSSSEREAARKLLAAKLVAPDIAYQLAYRCGLEEEVLELLPAAQWSRWVSPERASILSVPERMSVHA